jgi:hypothetical protein
MENNKYYTPTIEDIYIGFEYEYLNSKEIWVKSNDFSNEYMYEDSPLYGVYKDIENEKIRVKYLDKEDIETEGFELVDEGEYQVDSYYSKKVDKVQAVIEYRVRLWSDSWVNIWSEDTGSTYFGGTIKNKSEFKRILKMIGV